jgi:hypothetical protein
MYHLLLYENVNYYEDVDIFSYLWYVLQYEKQFCDYFLDIYVIVCLFYIL